MEDWFSRYLDDHKKDLRIRLRSSIDRHFLSAFFELYLYELLNRLGYNIKIHPEIRDGVVKRPDFHLSRSGGEDFYLEGVLATDLSNADVGAASRMEEVYGALNDIESPNFFVGIKIYDMPSTPVPKRKLKEQVAKFLSSMDPDILAEDFNKDERGDLPSKTFTHNGWNLEYFAIPKSKKSRGKKGIRPLGVRMQMPRWIDTRTAVRDAIVKKSTKYGNLGKPYVIAVNTLTEHFDKISAMEALFGQETFLVSADSFVNSEPRMIRKPDGAWYGPQGAQNTRVSAVLIGHSIMPWTVAVHTPTVYHNPWAQFPCLAELIQLPHSVPRGERMESIAGLKANEILGLPENWPN